MWPPIRSTHIWSKCCSRLIPFCFLCQHKLLLGMAQSFEPNESSAEVELVLGMYSDDVREVSRTADAVTIVFALPCEFALELRVPAHGYPLRRPATVRVLEGRNVAQRDELERMVFKYIQANLSLGMDMLVPIIQYAQESARAIEENRKAKEAAAECPEEDGSALVVSAEDQEDGLTQGSIGSSLPERFRLRAGCAIVDRKSRFLCHIACVASVEDVRCVIEALRANKCIGSATHPCIYAYRFTCPQTHRVVSDHDDDGESGAAKRLMFLLEQCQVDGFLLVVTRWFGGILLSTDRFKHITDCAKQTLLQYGVVDK